MAQTIRGVFPTMITPFTSENELDLPAVKRLVKWYVQKGCTGIFSVCQSSEMFYLSLDERIRLADTVIQSAKALNPNVQVVVSGHVSCSFADQVKELSAMAALHPDALVFISNRLDQSREGDEVWIRNAQRLLSELPEDIPLGIYECPYPYKRLLSTEILKWCKQSGRFRFIKDTCCDASLLASRLDLLKGSEIGLYNANAQTLLYSLRHGAAGYSGVMANFHPELYLYLCRHFESEPEICERLQSLLCMTAFTESLAYPVTAKYHLNAQGIGMDLFSRTRPMSDLKEYDRLIVDQMQQLSEYTAQQLHIR